jgi:hypothetical protein
VAERQSPQEVLVGQAIYLDGDEAGIAFASG